MSNVPLLPGPFLFEFWNELLLLRLDRFDISGESRADYLASYLLVTLWPVLMWMRFCLRKKIVYLIVVLLKVIRHDY